MTVCSRRGLQKAQHCHVSSYTMQLPMPMKCLNSSKKAKKKTKKNKQTKMTMNKNNFKSLNWVESLDAGCPQRVINSWSRNVLVISQLDSLILLISPYMTKAMQTCSAK